jgi:CheY-like chemotaxis protein
MAGETILVVDDAAVNLKLTDIVLRKDGFCVHAFTNAEDALAALPAIRPSVVLTDIQMPGMDGLEMTRRIKSDESTRGIVVVALTACAMMDDEQRALDAGCDGYITKPIDTHTLGSRVREYLARGTATVRAEGA